MTGRVRRHAVRRHARRKFPCRRLRTRQKYFGYKGLPRLKRAWPPKSVTTRGKSLTSLSRFHVAFMHGKFAAAKVSTFVVSDFCVVWDFDCQRLCITPLARSSCADPARARPANWIMRPGPGPARKKYVQARPGPQHNCHSWGPGPAQARGLRAGPLARPHRSSYTTKTAILLLCTHSNVTWLLSCYVDNHMHFQCLCEV